MTTQAVILHSGGLDSTVCLLRAREEGKEVLSLGFDYGQRHRIELEYAANQCAKYGITRRVLKIEWDKTHRELPLGRSVKEILQGVSTAFLQGRNAVFLSLGCAEAAGVNATEVWIGVNAVEYSGYPDCRPEFIDSFQKMIQAAIPGGPTIQAPLLHLSKPAIAREAARMGLARGSTWSCYSPKINELGIAVCGRCDACVLHDHAWDNLSDARGQ